LNPTQRAGYFIVAASFLIQGVAIGGMFAYGVLFAELISTFGWSRATISGAISVATITMGIVGVLAGRLNDRFGPRWILSVSALFYGAGFILMSTLSAPWQLYLFWGVMVGIGLSTHDVITLSTVARWFPRKRGLMSAIIKVGTGCGQMTVPILVAGLIAAYDWRVACQVFGAGALVILLVAAQFMRRDPGVAAAETSHSTESNPAGNAQKAPAAPDLSFRAALRLPAMWLLCAAQIMVIACLGTITVHIVPHAIDLGLSRASAASLLASIGGISLLGRLTVGATIDRIGGRRALLACYCLLFASLVWLQFAQTPWMLFVFAAGYGIAHGGFFTAISPTVAELFGTRAHGALFGTVLFFGSLGSALGPFAAGAVFDALGSYKLAFGILCLLAATGFVLISRLAPASSR
jgi:MFS family permease